MVIHMPPPKNAALLPSLTELMPEGSNDLNEVFAMLPKSSLSFRVPAIHAVALKVISQETGLSVSEVAERLLCGGITDALANKRLPPFEDQGAIRLTPVGQDRAAS